MRIIVVLFLGLVATGCAEAKAAGSEERAVRLATTGCGYASGRTGSGVVIADGLVATAAHLVIQADTVEASIGDAPPIAAEIAAIDRQRDLALLRVPPTGIGTVPMAGSDAGAEGKIVGGATSGTVAFVVERPVGLTIEEVLGTERHRRLGYQLEATTATGDSGAGAYDTAGRLIGLVFATSSDDPTTTWITASEEIEDLVEEYDEISLPWLCDPDRSQVAAP